MIPCFKHFSWKSKFVLSFSRINRKVTIPSLKLYSSLKLPFSLRDARTLLINDLPQHVIITTVILLHTAKISKTQKSIMTIIFRIFSFRFNQEPISRGEQLPYSGVTAFSRTDLLLVHSSREFSPTTCVHT